MQYLLHLGRLPELSTFEISHLFADFSPEKFDKQFLLVDCDNRQHILDLLNKSGGITKALEIKTVVSQDEVEKWIVEYLQTKEKPTFSLTQYTNPNDFHLDPADIKKQLREKGVSSRFLQQTSGLPAAIFLNHPDTIELSIIPHDGQITIAQTIWVQDIDDWTTRDRGKPYSDRKKGMLPPKLARMMVNFVSPELSRQENKTLLDPFCGTGTVLMEASLNDWQVCGSDFSDDAVHGTAENMHWFSQEYSQPEPRALFVADATHVNLQQLPQPVDAIVTEPFLGKPQPDTKDLPNIFKGLEKMYLGCFKNWTKILKNGGEVVIATPLVESPKHTYSLAKLIDNLPSLGYNLISGPLMYSREQTVVQRAIYVLKYKNK